MSVVAGHRWRPEQYDNRRGERNSSAKLTEADVRAIRALRSPTDWRRKKNRGARNVVPSLAELAERYGVTKPVITAVVQRYTWRHIP